MEARIRRKHQTGTLGAVRVGRSDDSGRGAWNGNDHESSGGPRVRALASNRGSAGAGTRPDQILVKVEACGVCHTDLHAADGDWPVKPTPPFIPGHEGVGHVAAVGRDAKGATKATGSGYPGCTAPAAVAATADAWETLAPSRTPGIRSMRVEYVSGGSRFRRPSAGRARVRAGGADPVRRRDGVQGLKETEAKPGTRW